MARRKGRLLVVVVLVIAACQDPSSPAADNERLIRAYQNGEVGFWLSGAGEVQQVYGDDELSGVTTQRIEVGINDEVTIILRYRLTQQGRVPVKPGTQIQFRGIYDWRPNGGEISIDNTSEAAPKGWIQYQQQRYE